MADGEISADLVYDLGSKIEGLELTEAEQAILGAVLERAESAGDEVAGFGLGLGGRRGFKGGDEQPQLNDMGMTLMRAAGFHIHVNPYIGETEKNLS